MIQRDAIKQRIAFNCEPFRDNNEALRVLLVYKKSRLETYNSEQTSRFETNSLIDEHNQHSQCLEAIKKALMTAGASVQMCYRGDLSTEKTLGRIIVTVGGDGTILDASHYAFASPIFGVNSDPSRSVGSLCLARLESFSELFQTLNDRKLLIQPIARIGGTLNGEKLPILALNEVLVAHQNPAALSRYKIELGNKSEEQRSSGIWIAAPMGSTGATLSAGGHVRSLSDSRLQLLVREPYFSFGKVTTMLSGLIEKEMTLKLTSRMVEGQIFFDGPHCSEKFGIGSELELHSNGQPLLLFVNDEMESRRSHLAHLRETFYENRIRGHQESVI